MEIKNNKLFYFYMCLISMAVITGMMYFSGVCCFFDDDTYFSVYEKNEEFFDCLFGDTRFTHGGYYIGLFLSKFLSFGLPTLLSLHPGDFITYGQGFARSIFTVTVLSLMPLFAVYKTNAKSIYAAVFSFLAVYFFFRGLDSCVLVIIYNFYRYFFSLIFFSIFWYFIYKNILFPPVTSSKKSIKYLQITGVALCGFILGTSIEIAFYVSIFLGFLIIGYNILLRLLSLIKKKESLLSQRFNLKAEFFIPLTGLLTGIILFVTNPGALIIAKERGMGNIYINYDIIKNFSVLYFQRYFQEEWLYWIIFVILMLISFYFAFKKKEIKEILFPMLMTFSILAVMFSLILCGKTNGGHYFIDTHSNIRFLYRMLIIYPLLIFLNYIIRNKFLNYAVISILIFIGAGICLYNTNNILNSEYYKKSNHHRDNTFISYNSHKTNREIYYKTEKISRFYIERDENPILLPDYSDDITEYPYPFEYTEKKEINHNKINDYMLKVYKDKKEFEYKTTDKEKAIEEYYKRGGTFSEEELKHIKFLRLFDKKFVLNAK